MFPLNWAFAEPAKNNMAARNPRDHDKDNLTLIFFLYPPLDPKQAFSERPSKAAFSVNVFLQVPGLYAVGNGAVKQILFCIQSKSLGLTQPQQGPQASASVGVVFAGKFPEVQDAIPD
jgi:hypothetical protein